MGSASAGRAGPDMGVAPCRIRAGCSRGRLVASGRAIVGRRATGRSGAWPRCHRLGIAAREPGRTARSSARALVERAGRAVFMGRSQD